MDEWLLPVTETVGTCNVSVQISPYWIVEAGTWGEVKTAARGVTDKCWAKGALGDDVTGGAVRVGRHDGILVWIMRRNGDGEVGTDI